MRYNQDKEMKQIIFVTGNKYKFEVAQEVLKDTDIKLIQQKIETPEIQSAEVEEIAAYSAKFAAEKLGRPVALTDAGWYINALNGFPGPFVKFINNWLSSNDLIKLIEGKEDRTVTIKACLAYCEPKKESVTFISKVTGKLALTPRKTDKEGNTPINELFVPEGFDKTESEIPREEMIRYWAKLEDYWLKLADYLKTK